MLFRRRRRLIDTYLPWQHHVGDEDNIIHLDHDGLFVLFEMRGMSWETKSFEEILWRQAALNTLYHRSLFHPNVIIHEYRCRTGATPATYPRGQFRSEFASSLDADYEAKLFSDLLYENSIYLGIEIFTTATTRATQTLAERIEHMQSLIRLIQFNLTAYKPRLLSIRDGRSEIAETVVFAMTGIKRPIGLTTGRMGHAMFSERVHLGWESIEFEGPGFSWFGAAFGMRHYLSRGKDPLPPGPFDHLLCSPYRHTLHQSYRFIPPYAAQKTMRDKHEMMVAASDPAASQAEALKVAADGLGSADYCLGDHSLVYLVFANTMRELQEAATAAWSDLSSCGATVIREKWMLEGAWASLSPGNKALSPRPGDISSVNMTCLAPMHSYPTGEVEGYWGQPLALFRTRSGEPYRFHLHVRDAANTLICGATRSGKSTLLAFLLAQAERFDATIVAWDKDRGLKILIEALGGPYLELKPPTGIAPLRRLTDNPVDIAFLIALFRGCIGTELTPDMADRLHLGVSSVMQLDPPKRDLAEVCKFLGTQMNGPGARLARWCWGNELGGIIDNPADLISLDALVMGFDQTHILDDPNARGPVMATLYHYVEKLIDGRRLIFTIDEFWKSLLDPSFRHLVNDKLKTLGKQNAPVILITQSPRDALQSDIAHTLREQTANKIFFNCGSPVWADFGPNGMGVSETVFNIIRALPQGTGEFVICQDDEAVCAQLPLQGLTDHIAVLSGRTNTVKLYDQVSANLAAFHAARKELAPA